MIEMFVAWSAGDWKRQLAVFVIVTNTALSTVILMACAVSGLGILELDAQAILNGCVLGYVLSCIIGVLVSAVHNILSRDDGGIDVKREDYLPADLLPRPANWCGGDPEPDFKECPNNPNKVWVLSSGGYILYDKREENRGIDMILSSQTRLFIGGELLAQVGVSQIRWGDIRDARVEVFGPFPEARAVLEKIVDGVEIGVVAICAGDHVCRCNGELLMSLKGIRDIERWICYPVVLSPDNLSCLTIKASFKCVLEFVR